MQRRRQLIRRVVDVIVVGVGDSQGLSEVTCLALPNLLDGGLEHVLFFHILGINIPTD